MATIDLINKKVEGIGGVSEVTPIDQKYKKLGGSTGFLGNATGKITDTPGKRGQYCEYDHGMIFYNPSLGSYAISSAIVAYWKSDAIANTKAIGTDTTIMDYLGFPVSDSFKISDSDQACYFERGMIVIDSASGYAIYGHLYKKYRRLNDVKGHLGLPTSSVKSEANNGTVCNFNNGNIYCHDNSIAFEVAGKILEKYEELGGPSRELGFPISDVESITKNKIEKGSFCDFEGGGIYSSDKGTYEVLVDIQKAWLHDCKGPLGELGFPISEQKKGNDNIDYQNFEKGVLILEKNPFIVRKITDFGPAVSDVIDGSYKSVTYPGGHCNYNYQNFEKGILVRNKTTNDVQKITNLKLTLFGLGSQNTDDHSLGTDWSSGQGLYLIIKVTTNKGQTFEARYPQGGQFGDALPVETYQLLGIPFVFEPIIPVNDGDLQVTVHMEGHCGRHACGDGGDWVLGEFTATYDIFNLWDTSIEYVDIQYPNYVSKFAVPGTLLKMVLK